MSRITTLREMLAAGDPSAVALVGVDGRVRSYQELSDTVERIAAQLAGAGVERTTPVAILLPNGPEAAVAFLAASLAGIAAPINPALRPTEIERLLASLGTRLVVTSPDPPKGLAELQDITGLTLDGTDLGAGLKSDGHSLATGRLDSTVPGDAALLLHTSGTTAAPKKVQLTHANLTASAANISAWFELSPADRCLNVMPLFHVHGLMGSLLATIAAGGAIVCAPGFDAFKFSRWLGELKPSWFSAVPTIHQLILARAEPGVRPDVPLRFLRSSSAALPPTLMRDMESLFDTPMLEAFGMTEASHQMAANPLAPAERKPGSVGLPTGVDLAILDSGVVVRDPGATGEVLVRGETVHSGYIDVPEEVNRGAFVDGWFRTGDLGYIDDEGYVYLAGRLKEIINRGGENISPREIDEALLEHPAVTQAAAFAMPNKLLGEAVAAVVVLDEMSSASEADLRGFLRERLAAFKIPDRIVLVSDIPKGPTGKIQRVALAAVLGLGDRS